MTEKTIGILGGMGPEATIDLYNRIMKATPAMKDQDHIKTIIYCNPKIPDRTRAILGDGISPLPDLIETASAIKCAGADFIIIPCNTAHYFLNELRKEITIPIIHMIDLALRYLTEKYPNIKRIGLLATDGTIQSKIYHKTLEAELIQVVLPLPEKQKSVMSAIYDHIKIGDLETGRLLLNKVTDFLVKSGVEIIIVGCTEISLVIKNGDLNIPVLDPMQVLAEYSVNVALGRISLNTVN